MRGERFGAAKSIIMGRDQNPNSQRTCPVCGKYAQTKYLSDATGKWTYRHTERIPGDRGGFYSQTHYHEADR